MTVKDLRLDGRVYRTLPRIKISLPWKGPDLLDYYDGPCSGFVDIIPHGRLLFWWWDCDEDDSREYVLIAISVDQEQTIRKKLSVAIDYLEQNEVIGWSRG